MIPPIRSFDLTRSLAAVREEILEGISRVLDSGTVILGPETERFEQEFRAFTGSAYAIGVASGTDALILALRACEVRAGDEVITVANTAVPTAAAIRAVGAIPVFADVNEATLLIDPGHAESLITPRTRALLAVHLYGLVAPMDELRGIADRSHLRIIEDCAHAHGGYLDGQHAGTFGDIGCFSFYPTKNIGALGDAGLCVTQDPQLAERLRRLRMYGFDAARIAETDGLNSRLDEIQAAILRVRLKWFPETQSRRRRISERYLSELRNLPVRLPSVDKRCEHAWHQFVIRTEARKQLQATFAEHGIGWAIHYEHCLHQMPAFARLDSCDARLPVSERAAGEILSLPCSADLTDDECDRVIQAMRVALS